MTVEKPVIKEVTKPCISDPPPEMIPIATPTVCVPGFICFKLEDAITLADNVERLQQRVATDYARCGEPPSDGPGAGTPQ